MELRRFEDALRRLRRGDRGWTRILRSSYNTRGVALAHMGEYEKAFQDYDKAIALESGLRGRLHEPRRRLWQDRAPGRGASRTSTRPSR